MFRLRTDKHFEYDSIYPGLTKVNPGLFVFVL